MTYEDFSEIFKDELSDTYSQHLKVLGWISKTPAGKKYVVECEICRQDPELHGDGLYTIDKPNLIKGVIPCACAKVFRWSDEQWCIKLARASDELKYKFIRYIGGKGSNRSAVFLCEEHGAYTAGVYNYIQGKGCKRCHKANIKPDQEMISGFMQSGCFSEETIFTRSSRKDSKGAKVYWWVNCAVCGIIYESSAPHLKNGKQGCSCSIGNQRTAYLFQISDSQTPVALKFGITKSPKARLYQQQKSSSFNIEPLGYWQFSDSIACKAAELECSRVLTCGIMSSSDFSDGYTETTFLNNFNKIIDIYDSYGGVRIYV